MSDTYTQVDVDDHGASLMVPRQLLSELIEQANGRADPVRADFPITNFPFGQRSSLQTLGNQPTHEVLLDNVKGWPAIAGNAVAQRIRGLAKKLHVFSKHTIGGKVEVREQPDHRLSLTLSNPNPVFTLGDMLWLLTWHLQQVGEGYWQKINDGMGRVVEFWPLPPSAVTPVTSRELGVSGYLVKDGEGKEHALEMNEVIRFWNPDPKTLFGAMGRLGPQAIEFDQARFLEDHLKATFEDNATPRMAIIGKEGQASIDPKVQREFYRKWKNLFNARVGSARSVPAFIPPGWDLKELTTHGAANEVIPLRESNREHMLAAWGVPGTVLGMDKNLNRATAEALEWIFDKNTITHYTDLIAEGLTIRCARDFDPKLAVGFKDFVSPDKVHDLAREKQDLDEGVRTVQQVLRDRNENPADAPWGSLPILPFNLSPFDGDFKVEDRVKAIGLQGSSSSGTDDRAGKKKRVHPTRDDSIHSMTRDHPMDVDAAQRRAIVLSKRFVSPLSGAVLRILKSQKIDVLERLAEFTPDQLLIPVPIALDKPRQRAAQMRTIAESLAKKLFDPESWDRVFGAAMVDHIAEPFAAAAADATMIVAKETFVFSTFAQEAVEHQTFKLAGAVDATTLRRVKDALQGSLDSGEGTAGVANRLQSTFNRKRAKVIARTEVLTAVQQGQLQGWRSTELVQGKQWNISNNNTRDSHLLAAGQIVPLGADFVLGSGAQASAPGDTNLTAADRVNCQCFLSPVMTEAPNSV